MIVIQYLMKFLNGTHIQKSLNLCGIYKHLNVNLKKYVRISFKELSRGKTLILLFYFKDDLRQWKELTCEEKKDHILRLLNLTEIHDKKTRDKAYRAILYIAQGTRRHLRSNLILISKNLKETLESAIQSRNTIKI
jgi:ribosomal protein L31E